MHHHSIALIALLAGVAVGYLAAAQVAASFPNFTNKVIL